MALECPPRAFWYYYDWTRHTLTIKERKVQLLKQLSEKTCEVRGQCVTVVLGKDKATDETVVAKIKYEYVLIILILIQHAFCSFAY